MREVGAPSRNILHVRPVGLLTGIGVTRESVLRALVVCAKKHRIVYDTAILAPSGAAPWRQRAGILLWGFTFFTTFTEFLKTVEKYKDLQQREISLLQGRPVGGSPYASCYRVLHFHNFYKNS